ncbi:MAG: hypothetical protein E4H28_06970 [Gemmatimonadales bacterium]|nr:MAG: hypothetical protein E4H28_06970 [Gemmatimonadales bacterium]
MSFVPISALPSDARIWCFGASARPTGAAVEKLRTALAVFLENWTAHRADLRAGFDWLNESFLVIAVDESEAGASGCSIDALTSEIRRLEGESGIDLLDAAPVWYREATGEVRRVTRDEFRQLAAAGSVTETTQVFDLTVERLEAVRSGGWEVEAGSSWHARLL